MAHRRGEVELRVVAEDRERSARGAGELHERIGASVRVERVSAGRSRVVLARRDLWRLATGALRPDAVELYLGYEDGDFHP